MKFKNHNCPSGLYDAHLGFQSFQQMPNISKDLKEKLDKHFIIDWGRTSADTISADGTRKLLIDFGGSEVECTWINAFFLWKPFRRDMN